ncbi:MAG: hypothetical protein RIG27_33855 [Coleofasciculus sp. F4-SAH-05]
MNVLPDPIGVELGYEWERQTTTWNLTGNLAQYEARAVVVQAAIAPFEPVQLVFAWTQATNVPLIFGQVNFFMEFDVCFYRSQLQFEVTPKATGFNEGRDRSLSPTPKRDRAFRANYCILIIGYGNVPYHRSGQG